MIIHNSPLNESRIKALTWWRKQSLEMKIAVIKDYNKKQREIYAENIRWQIYCGCTWRSKKDILDLYFGEGTYP